MQRREVVLAALAMPLAAGSWRAAGAQGRVGEAAVPLAAPFDEGTVPALARELASRAYVPPTRALPPWLDAIGYDQYRDLRFRPERALWREAGLPFRAQFFHRGFLFKERVDLFEVADGRARALPYSPALFDTSRAPGQVPADLGFAGFRLHAPLNRADVFDEVCAFLGASYFRAVARGQHYGLSARGLALNTGAPEPEEFPIFRAFWLERPAASAETAVVHALLDSPSAAAAFRFEIAPGAQTVFDVDMRLTPRVALDRVGIAPLTSMFAFDAGDRVGIDDFRPAVHDSDGLALHTGSGEQVWRPLANPAALQISGFQDRDPRGFGLMQRKRAYADYLDPEAAYHRRPSLWVEPRAPWGEGEVVLVEIPTRDEYGDNIVAFWRPRAPLAAGREHRFRYRLHWCDDHAWQPDLARVAATRAGASWRPNTRLFVLDLHGGRLAKLPATVKPQVEAATSAGELHDAVAYRVEDTGGWRMSFVLEPGAAPVAELRARLRDDDGSALSETWLYRWTA